MARGDRGGRLEKELKDDVLEGARPGRVGGKEPHTLLCGHTLRAIDLVLQYSDCSVTSVSQRHNGDSKSARLLTTSAQATNQQQTERPMTSPTTSVLIGMRLYTADP